jgi:hypothetical protein
MRVAEGLDVSKEDAVLIVIDYIVDRWRREMVDRAFNRLEKAQPLPSPPSSSPRSPLSSSSSLITPNYPPPPYISIAYCRAYTWIARWRQNGQSGKMIIDSPPSPSRPFLPHL